MFTRTLASLIGLLGLAATALAQQQPQAQAMADTGASPAQTQITPQVPAERIKDVATVAGVRSNQLVGYGIVVGLNGTGDGNVAATLQSMQSMLSRFGVNIDPASINAKNAAAVMVTAELPAFAKPGQKMDITVAAVGKAASLVGGSLFRYGTMILTGVTRLVVGSAFGLGSGSGPKNEAVKVE
jgi:flagellar basal body P-ring protein FlgI